MTRVIETIEIGKVEKCISKVGYKVGSIIKDNNNLKNYKVLKCGIYTFNMFKLEIVELDIYRLG